MTALVEGVDTLGPIRRPVERPHDSLLRGVRRIASFNIGPIGRVSEFEIEPAMLTFTRRSYAPQSTLSARGRERSPALVLGQRAFFRDPNSTAKARSPRSTPAQGSPGFIDWSRESTSSSIPRKMLSPKAKGSVHGLLSSSLTSS